MSVRETILSQAKAILAEVGASGLTVDAILARAQVSKGGFFHHFRTKSDLLGVLFQETIENFEARLADRRQSGKSFALALIDTVLEEVNDNPLMINLLIAGVATLPDLKQMVQIRRQSWVEELVGEGMDPLKANVLVLALEGNILASLLDSKDLMKTNKASLLSLLNHS